MSKVIFKQDTQLSYDGYNVKTYIGGQEYEPKHAHEARMFGLFVEKGEAEQVDTKQEIKVETVPKKTNKTFKPRAKK